MECCSQHPDVIHAIQEQDHSTIQSSFSSAHANKQRQHRVSSRNMTILAMNPPTDLIRPKSLHFSWEANRSSPASPRGFASRTDQREPVSLPSIRKAFPELQMQMASPETAAVTEAGTIPPAHTTPMTQPSTGITMSSPHNAGIVTTATSEYVHSPSSAYKRQRVLTASSAYNAQNIHRQYASNDRNPGYDRGHSHSHGHHNYSADEDAAGAMGEGRERLMRTIPRIYSDTDPRNVEYGETQPPRHAPRSSSVSPPASYRHPNSTGRAGFPGLHPLRFEHNPEPAVRYGHDAYRSDGYRTGSSHRHQPPEDYPGRHYSRPPPSTSAYPPPQHHAHHPSRVQSLSADTVSSYDRATFPSATASGYGQPRQFVGHSQPYPGGPTSVTPGYPHYHPRDYPVAGGYMSAGAIGGMSGGNSASDGKQRKRRGNLPKETTDKLRTWFVGHLHHPYPSEDEKQDLMRQTGLQMNQISNWFINARRRQLPSLIKNAHIESNARASRSSSSNVAGVRRNSNSSLDGRPSSMERSSLSPEIAAFQQQQLSMRQFQSHKRPASDYDDDRGNNVYVHGSPISDDGYDSLPRPRQLTRGSV